MTACIIKNSNYKFLVIGPIYNQLDKLKNIENKFSTYDMIIFNGNLCYPFDDLSAVKRRIDIMKEYQKSGKVIYNNGSYDYQFHKNLLENQMNIDIQKWIQLNSNVVIIGFDNQTTVIVTAGGITSKMNKTDLIDNLETTFVSEIDGVSWHKMYGGAHGYIISNNPLTKKKPQFYNFSAQIGNLYEENCNVFAQEVTRQGLGQTILL